MADLYFDIETTGLNPYEDSILTIQLKNGAETVVWKRWESDSEVHMVQEFLKCLQNAHSRDSIYGYNVLKFDVPFIAARLNVHSLMDGRTHGILYDSKWIDLYQYLGDNHVPMDRWLEYYGIERKCSVRGRDVPHLHRRGEYEAIEAHAIDDIVALVELVRKLRIVGHEKPQKEGGAV